MFCSNCGSNVSGASGFCPNCGSRMHAGAGAPASTGGYAAPHGFFANSSWDGGVFDTFVNSIVASLICTFTCGIAAPWAICYMLKFIISHTVIDGKRYRFEGEGASLFGNYFVWAILTCITCGIYGFWVVPKFYNWIVSNIHSND